MLEPSIKAEYGVDVPWWIWVVAGVALVIFFAYQGISISEKALIITGLIEIVIMVGLAFTGLASPGPGGFSLGPLNPANFGLAGNLFLGVVFSIFAFSGWESTGPLAEESRNPKRNVPIGLVVLVAVVALVQETPRERRELDVRGALLSILGLLVLVYGLARGLNRAGLDGIANQIDPGLATGLRTRPTGP